MRKPSDRLNPFHLELGVTGIIFVLVVLIAFMAVALYAPLARAASTVPPDSVRDNFNRPDGAIGANWVGDVGSCGIAGGRLKVLTLTAAAANPWVLWSSATSLDPMQYAHMTISSPAGIAWQCLTLRGQPSTDSRIQISFKSSTVVVQTRTDGVWQGPTSTATVSVSAGDKVSAKVDSFGTVTVYKNGATALTSSLGTWKYATSPGAPGIAGSVGMLADDFGFGTWRSTTGPPPPTNRPPVAVASGALTVAFTGAASSDPDGDALAFAWNFGDGSTATGSSVTHSYAAAGSYTATLTVTDGKGGSSTSSVGVALTLPPPPTNSPPTAIASASPMSGVAPLTVALSATGSNDPNGDVMSFAWTYGDGGSGLGQNITHVYTAAGSYTATVTVTDGRGGTSSASKTIVVTSPPPPVLHVTFSFHTTATNDTIVSCPVTKLGSVKSDSVMAHWRIMPMAVEDSLLKRRGDLVAQSYPTTSTAIQNVTAWLSRWGYANGRPYYARNCDAGPIQAVPK